MGETGTTLVRIRLGRQLRTLREAAGVTTEDMEREGLGSKTKIWRVENGRVSVDVPTVRAWCGRYKVPKRETEALVEMALGTAKKGWWREFGESVPGWFELYLDLEGDAARIFAWDGILVPGLFQTADYARAVISAAVANNGRRSVDAQVEVRLDRQRRVLNRQQPPRLAAVIGEGALTQRVGGEAVMAEQIAHLRKLAKQPLIEIGVLPFGVGAHPAMAGAFQLLEFTSAVYPNCVYAEGLTGGLYLEKRDELDRYSAAWEKISKQSVPIGEYT